MKDFEKEKSNLKNYKRILNNLFDINWNDPSLFTDIDNETYLDIYTKFGPKVAEIAFNKNDFGIPLVEKDLIAMAKALKEARNIEEVEKIFQYFKQELDIEMLKKFNKDFEEAIKELIDKLNEKYQKANSKWKKFLNRANEINAETNVWPMQIGFFFVSISTEKRNIYAPIFLKEVNIKFMNSQPYLISNGDVKLNEKLVLFLENEGFFLDVDFDLTNLSIKQITEKLAQNWGKIYKLPTVVSPLAKMKTENIVNRTLSFNPGLVLGFFQPAGGHQRKVMEQIIKNDELDEILEVEFDKNIYKNRIKESIFQKPFNFFKINKTNFSQDKATTSALNQNTIIWGPPGTGKSQTISNIIANIITFKKTALVVSQKKAALDVLKSRMKSLSIFCLFILNDRNMNKKNFYEPIQKLINLLENYNHNPSIKPLNIISEEEKKYLNLLKKIKTTHNSKENIELFSLMKKNMEFLSSRTIEAFYNISKNIKLNPASAPEDFSQLKWAILESQTGRKISWIKKLFTKVSDTTNHDAEIILNELKDYRGNLNEILTRINNVSITHLNDINDFYNYIIPESNQINDDKELAKWIAYRLVKEVKSFDDEYKKLYNKFAMAVRLAHRDPYKFVLDHSKIIKRIFPVIISTPETELSPWGKREFDYAIMDESSQIFLEKGIPILYLAKIKVLAGDDQQMQPTRWFSSRSFEEDIEFGNIESLLDYAVSRGLFSILLDKNYRSNSASLMTFSSKHFYSAKLDVLNKNGYENYKSIEVVEVPGVWNEGKNILEAEMAIQKTLENLDKFPKIIILTFNSHQQLLIENMIFDKYPQLEKALETQKITLKNIENIQGDEADLVIMSVVYDKSTKLHSTYVAKPGGKNALNVAISRAKNKMIVIKSIHAKEIETLNISPDMDVFRKWLLFLELNEKDRMNYAENDSNLENTFTKTLEFVQDQSLLDEIYETLDNSIFLKNKSFRIEKNFSIGTKKLDIAIVHNKSNQIIHSFSVDNYDYYDSQEEYIKFHDKNAFLNTKNYNVELINPLIWNIEKDKIIHKIQELVNNFKLENNFTIEMEINNSNEKTQEEDLSISRNDFFDKIEKSEENNFDFKSDFKKLWEENETPKKEVTTQIKKSSFLDDLRKELINKNSNTTKIENQTLKPNNPSSNVVKKEVLTSERANKPAIEKEPLKTKEVLPERKAYVEDGSTSSAMIDFLKKKIEKNQEIQKQKKAAAQKLEEEKQAAQKAQEELENEVKASMMPGIFDDQWDDE